MFHYLPIAVLLGFLGLLVAWGICSGSCPRWDLLLGLCLVLGAAVLVIWLWLVFGLFAVAVLQGSGFFCAAAIGFYRVPLVGLLLIDAAVGAAGGVAAAFWASCGSKSRCMFLFFFSFLLWAFCCWFCLLGRVPFAGCFGFGFAGLFGFGLYFGHAALVLLRGCYVVQLMLMS